MNFLEMNIIMIIRKSLSLPTNLPRMRRVIKTIQGWAMWVVVFFAV